MSNTLFLNFSLNSLFIMTLITSGENKIDKGKREGRVVFVTRLRPRILNKRHVKKFGYYTYTNIHTYKHIFLMTKHPKR